MIPAEAVERFRSDLAKLTASPPDRFGVAVSGGADSLALLLLAAATCPGRVSAISIDHRLRPDSADECRFVAGLCARLGVPHQIVGVTVDPRRIGVQAAARAARRSAWHEWAVGEGLAAVLTAHHADDQAETVLMRLARGAGVGGLAGIPAAGRLGGEAAAPVALLRPLLGWTRAELAAIPAAAGIVPVQDPANADPRFDRTRFRQLLAASDLFDPRRLAAAAHYARDADTALDWMAGQLAAEHLRIVPGRVELRPGALPREVVRRLVLAALQQFGRRPDNGPKVHRLMALLLDGRPAMLAGIKVTPGPVWTFAEAPPRRH